MSRKSKLSKIGRTDKAARHIRLHHWLMQTAAWCSLKSVDRALYIEVLSRYGGPGSNNGAIPYSVREAATALHVGKSTAAEAFQRLQERGFISSVQKGEFHCKIRHSTEWRLTEFPSDVDIPGQMIKARDLATKDFARWQPEKQKPVRMEDRAVPETGQYGTSERTTPAKKAAYGI